MDEKNSSEHPTANLWLIRIVSTLFFVLFRVLNRTKVYGRKKLINALKRGNVVVGCNHLSAWDSFCLAVSLVYLKMMFNLRYAPISSPKFRSEIKPGGLGQKFMVAMNCIFIDLNDRAKVGGWFRKVSGLLKAGGWTIIFGTGTRNAGPNFDQLGKWEDGSAGLIRLANSIFIPVGYLALKISYPKAPGCRGYLGGW
ncbi:MAG: 1-acyl-sn-glycerol-3-phosphate acyltransferase [Candidatus Buchananbacteria bacterium]|nr:1-acyl-sn-glycerol-3-phosphate acyltransferase [Candidatus Buchananbacteria bacterium]